MPELTSSPQQDPAQEMLYRRQLQQERAAARTAPAGTTIAAADSDAAALARALSAARSFESNRRDTLSTLRSRARAAQDAVAATKGISSKELQQLAGQVVTAQLLKAAWPMVLDFGVGLLYLNIHFIARYIMNLSVFCEFGTEWKLTTPAALEEAKKNGIPSPGALKYGEFIVLLVLNVLVLAIIVGLALAIGMALGQANPLLGKLLPIGAAGYNWFVETLK